MPFKFTKGSGNYCHWLSTCLVFVFLIVTVQTGKAQDKYSTLTEKVNYVSKATQAASLLEVLQQQTGYAPP